jgi:membrane protease YdiL (CAAX protease family)
MNKTEKAQRALMCVLKAGAYFGVYFACQIVLGLIIGLIFSFSAVLNGGSIDDSIEFITKYSLEITLISNILAILGCTGLAFLFKRETRRVDELLDINLCYAPRAKMTACFLFMGIVGQFAVSVILSLIPFPESWLEMLNENSDLIASGSFGMQVISVAIFAPLAEEIVFRACIQGSLQKGMPKWVAISLASLIFGLMHGTPISIIYATSLGILMGWLYAKFNSIVPSLLFHFTFNLSSVILANFEIDPLVLGLIALLCSVLFALCVVYIAICGKSTVINGEQKDTEKPNNDGFDSNGSNGDGSDSGSGDGFSVE